MMSARQGEKRESPEGAKPVGYIQGPEGTLEPYYNMEDLIKKTQSMQDNRDI